MIYKHLILVILLIHAFGVTVYAQVGHCPGCKDYHAFMKEGNKWLKLDSLGLALVEFQAAQIAARACDCETNEPADSIKTIFKRITNQREEAIKNEKKTIAALKQLRKTKVEMQIALNKANRLVNAFYFYDEKYALAYGNFMNLGEDLFYFIDTDGVPIVNFLGWKKAEQFDSRGFAKVEDGDDYYGKHLLDMSGRIFNVAYSLDELDYETEALDLSEQELGSIPSTIFDFTQLEVLLLNNNRLDSIPSRLYELKNLIILNIEGNKLKDVPSCVMNLPNLEILDLSNNSIINISPEIGKLKKLINLDLSKNEQIKDLPIGIYELVKLEKIDLSHIGLQKLPEKISNWESLTELNLSGNLLSGDNLIQIGSFKGLTKLNLSCGLHSVPPQIGLLDKLTFLDLSSNNLNQIPEEIGQLTKLKKLDLNSNDSLSQLPEQFAKLHNLLFLDLSYCSFEEVPAPVWKLKNLTELNLENTPLKNLSPQISRLVNLMTLYLTETRLKKIPKEIGKLENLAYLDLSNLPDIQLPSQIKNLENLTYLDLSNDNIERLLPQIGFLKNLSVLDISGNKIKDLPLELGQLKKLVNFEAEGNRLESISVIAGMKNLIQLDVSNNKLTQFPIAYSKLNRLKYLFIGGNPISDKELQKICKSFPLGVVVLEGNNHCQFVLEEMFNEEVENEAESPPALHEPLREGYSYSKVDTIQLLDVHIAYHLIAGSFQHSADAENRKNQLLESGYAETEIVEKEEGQFEILVKRYDTLVEAEQAKKELIEKHGIEARVEQVKSE